MYETVYRFIKSYWMPVWIVVALLSVQLTLFNKSDFGVYVNTAVFVSLMVLALKQEKTRPLVLSAAVMPVVAMITLSLPQTNLMAQAVTFNDALLVLAFIYRYVFKFEFPANVARLRLADYAKFLPFMLVIGQLLGIIGYGLLRNHIAFGHIPLSVIAGDFVLFAVAEELYFRGLIQQRASLIYNPKIAAILSAVLYAIFTFNLSRDYLSLIFGLIAGVELATIYYKKQSLILTFTANITSKLLYLGLLATFVYR